MIEDGKTGEENPYRLHQELGEEMTKAATVVRENQQLKAAIEKVNDPAERRRQAEAWCDAFEQKNAKWLKTTVASFDAAGEPSLSYEDVDTSLIPPRPRLYGLVGAEVIEEVWQERANARGESNAAPKPAVLST